MIKKYNQNISMIKLILKEGNDIGGRIMYSEITKYIYKLNSGDRESMSDKITLIMWECSKRNCCKEIYLFLVRLLDHIDIAMLQINLLNEKAKSIESKQEELSKNMKSYKNKIADIFKHTESEMKKII